MKELRREDLIYPELSYKIIGVLFDVHNEIGFGYHEKYYQRAIAKSFLENGIRFKEQVYAPLMFQGKVIGKFFIDFLVEDKVILEVKKGDRFSKKHIDQVNNYLKSGNIKLALLVNFTKGGVVFKRLVNIH